MLGIDVRTRGIAVEFEQFIAERDPALHERWTQDRRLLEMAAAGIANRAERALGDEA